MKVIIPPLSGFCHGVKHAQDEILKIRQTYKDQDIFVYGPLIHNKEFIEFLKNNRIYCIDDLDNLKESSILVIRTHGIPKDIEEKLRDKYKIYDLTCKKVKSLQKKIEYYHNNGYFIIITGKYEHPEVKGLISYAVDYLIIENENDFHKLKNLKELLHKNNYEKLLITSQTTSSSLLFENVCKFIIDNFKNDFIIECYNSICKITENKEHQALKLQNDSNITFVIGDKTSSNSKKLFEILKKNNPNTYFIENIQDLKNLNLNLKNSMTALVVSSASTPDFIENEIVIFLKNI